MLGLWIAVKRVWFIIKTCSLSHVAPMENEEFLSMNFYLWSCKILTYFKRNSKNPVNMGPRGNGGLRKILSMLIALGLYFSISRIIVAEGVPGGPAKNLPAMQETQVLSPGQEDPWRRKRLPSICLGNPMDRAAWWATVHGVTWGYPMDMTEWINHRPSLNLAHPKVFL